MTISGELMGQLGDDLSGDPRVTGSTMMGLPCLRWNGAFFACLDRRSGALVVKLPEARVDELVESGHAESFAPAGRRFRQWAAISTARRRQWSAFLAEAQEFASRNG
jgi:hypothetical protein